MFTGFLGFPCPYLPGKETPWQNSIISPIFQQHFSTNRRNSIQTRKLLYFHAKLGYYHGNSRLLPDSTIFSPIAILSAASKTKKSGAHHPPWWTPPSLKTLDFKPFFNTFACEYPNSYGIIFLLPPGRLLDIVHINSPRRRGATLDKGRGQNRDHRGHIHTIGVRPLAAGVKTATEGSDSWPLWLSVTAAPALHWHGSKIKQGISATPNMPKSLVFSGFSYILFIPFVSIKRFTFLCKWCLWYNRILPLNILIFILFDFFFQVEDSTYIK